MQIQENFNSYFIIRQLKKYASQFFISTMEKIVISKSIFSNYKNEIHEILCSPNCSCWTILFVP